MFEHGRIDQDAYTKALARYGNNERAVFTVLSIPVIKRFCKQTSRPEFPDKIIQEFCAVLWSVTIATGFPLPQEETGQNAPVDVDADIHSDRLASVLDQLDYPEYRMELAILANQFLKTLLQPEFRSCRLSYCKTNEAGVCERQSLARCKKRISGAHCVDCPLFIVTNPAKHPKVLKAQWAKEKRDELDEQMDVFLPEDFRQLKFFLHLHRRHGQHRQRKAPARTS